MVDLAELKKKAEAATKGPWEENLAGWVESEDGEPICSMYDRYEDPLENHIANREYIAAANPSVVLELIARLEEAERKLAELPSIAEKMCEPVPAKTYEHGGSVDYVVRTCKLVEQVEDEYKSFDECDRELTLLGYIGEQLLRSRDHQRTIAEEIKKAAHD